MVQLHDAARRLLSVLLAGAVVAAASAAGAQDKSCEQAKNENVEDYTKGSAPADSEASAYGAVLDQGGYLEPCNVPSQMRLDVCVAVKEGVAVGVTVTTDPPDAGVASCVAGQVRSLEFPSHPRLDIAKTTFSPGVEGSETRRASEPARSGDAAAPPSVPPSRGCGCELAAATIGPYRALLAALVGLTALRARRARPPRRGPRPR